MCCSVSECLLCVCECVRGVFVCREECAFEDWPVDCALGHAQCSAVCVGVTEWCWFALLIATQDGTPERHRQESHSASSILGKPVELENGRTASWSNSPFGSSKQTIPEVAYRPSCSIKRSMNILCA